MTTPSSPSPIRRSVPTGRCGAIARLLDLRPAGLGLRAASAQTQAWVAVLLLLWFVLAGAVASAATPPNTAITNTASASYDVGGVSLSASGAVTVTTAAATPAAIQFKSYIAGGAGVVGVTPQAVAAPGCLAGSSWLPMAAPSVPGVGAIPAAGTFPLAPASAYSSQDIAFIQVTDYSANVDPGVAEPLTITVSNASGDSEKLRLMETGPSTGQFVGYIPLSRTAVQPGNCRLEVKTNEQIVATYVQAGSSAVSTSVALVDPLGLVFDSATGLPIDGATVTLIDVATGQPAQVKGDDGVSSYPSTVVTGSTVTDAGGTVYSLASGRYQFPRVAAPGTYRLQVTPPLGYRFPSTVADATLQQLAAGPFQLSPISRGGQFTVLPGPPVEADVPLDPAPYGTVTLSKNAGKTVVAVGDFLPYTVAISNAGDQALPGLQLLDRLPPGFRYVGRSTRLNGAALGDPQISPDGRSLVFPIGRIAAKAGSTLTYLVAIGASATTGSAQNTIQAIGRVASNVAGATVSVREELNASRAILAGQVSVAPSCEADGSDRSSRRPLSGVRVLLQDGTYAITDAEGNWHIDNVRAGTHVVQVDTTTLPVSLQLRACEDSTRTGGRDHSQFVNVRGGTLWRADFRYAPIASCLRQRLGRDGRNVDVSLAAPIAQQSMSATVLLPAGARVDAASVLVDGKAPSAGAVQIENGFIVLRDKELAARWSRRLAFRTVEDLQGEVRLAVRSRGPSGNDAAMPPVVLTGPGESSACGPLAAADLDALRLAPKAQAVRNSADGDTVASVTTDAQGQTIVEQLPYDEQWVAAAQPGFEWLHPRADFSPALPSVKAAVKHARGETVELRVNGQPVDPLRLDGIKLNPAGTVALTLWRGVEVRSGSNLLEVIVRDGEGRVVNQERRNIHYGTTVARVELDAAKSRLVADGRSAPVVAVRFIDPEGKPVRRGLIGDYTVDAPYAPLETATAIQREPLSGVPGGRTKFEVGEGGIALIPLRPSSQSGEAVLRFELGANRTPEVRAWLQADQREWVLVGFAEGTVGHEALAGNMQALQEAGATDQLFEQNRLAFYAKGMVKGEYLLTAAYDSAKAAGSGTGPQLGQAIDPNRFYTLYGDGTQQQYDAASIRKLYLKIEKQQFYALFGDFNTGLTVTELGRYNRTVNGVKSEYRGEAFSYTAFATRTTQAHLKDEIQGDGTSGLYRLRARNVVPGSDKVRIEVRDRLQPERVLAARSLVTWLDYQVDHALGTLQLREPLASRDADLNPQFLVVDYESDNGGVEAWTAGGRAALQVTPDAVVGVTAIHEGDVGRAGRLVAADAALKLGDSTKARIEVASSSRQADASTRSGNAYLAEVQHDDGRTQWRAYAREQQAGFGLGQESAVAVGQRRVGVEGRAKVDDRVQLQGEVSRGDDLVGGATREIADARTQWQATEKMKLQVGARVINEKDGQGGSTSTRQVTAGASYGMLEQRLQLRAATEIDVGGRSTAPSAAFPNRVVLGADYRVAPGVSVTAQQEFAQAGSVHLSSRSVGLKAEPWSGAELRTSVGSQASNDADRLYASLGLIQRWRINEQWSVDGSIDQSRTLRGSLAANPFSVGAVPATGTVPTTSPLASLPSASAGAPGLGLVAGDYTAMSVGFGYHQEDWSANGRVERRTSETGNRLNVLAGAQRKLDKGEAVAFGMQWTSEHGGTTEGKRMAARASYLWRPSQGNWMVLNRLEYIDESTATDLASRLFTRKLIANTNANWKPAAGTQLSLQYGAKYVREMLQDFTASGYTDLLGLEARFDLSPKIDVGLHGGMLHAWSTRTRNYHLGLSVGYRVATNTWVSIGYNQLGFWDADFAGAQYRAKGVYLNIRTKFDQDTFDLNDRSQPSLPIK